MLPKMTRPRHLQAAARRRQRHADHHADRARPGDRQGPGAEARRRRLHHQAVRLHGAARPRRGRAAPRPPGPAGAGAVGDLPLRRRQRRLQAPRGAARGPAGRPLAARVPAPRLLHPAPRRGRSPARSCSTPSGTTTPSPSPARWTCTSPSCARRSRTTPPTPGTSSRSTGWGTSSPAERAPFLASPLEPHTLRYGALGQRFRARRGVRPRGAAQAQAPAQVEGAAPQRRLHDHGVRRPRPGDALPQAAGRGDPDHAPGPQEGSRASPVFTPERWPRRRWPRSPTRPGPRACRSS